MNTKNIRKLTSVILMITLLAAALPMPTLAATSPSDAMPYEFAPLNDKSSPKAPNAPTATITVNSEADTVADDGECTL